MSVFPYFFAKGVSWITCKRCQVTLRSTARLHANHVRWITLETCLMIILIADTILPATYLLTMFTADVVFLRNLSACQVKIRSRAKNQWWNTAVDTANKSKYSLWTWAVCYRFTTYLLRIIYCRFSYEFSSILLEYVFQMDRKEQINSFHKHLISREMIMK